MRRFGARDLAVRSKIDATPVTETDEAVEEFIRTELARARPHDAVVGEEGGVTGSGTRRWIIDPIDGTKSFVKGAPPWATLIGLQECVPDAGNNARRDNAAILVGVVSAPALGRRWWAARGTGALVNSTPMHVSAVARLDEALLCHADVLSYGRLGMGDEFASLAERVWDRRGFGDFWGHMLVAEGVADVMVEPEVSLWDVAALFPIVEEAGGRLTDRRGVATPDGGNAVTTNGVLHEEVLTIVGTRA